MQSPHSVKVQKLSTQKSTYLCYWQVISNVTHNCTVNGKICSLSMAAPQLSPVRVLAMIPHQINDWWCYSQKSMIVCLRFSVKTLYMETNAQTSVRNLTIGCYIAFLVEVSVFTSRHWLSTLPLFYMFVYIHMVTKYRLCIFYSSRVKAWAIICAQSDTRTETVT